MADKQQSSRLQALKLAVSQIEKQFGSGSIIKLSYSHKIYF